MPNFLYHRNSGRLYQIIGVDKTAGTVTMKNDMAAFTDSFDKDKFKAMGYFPIDGDDEDDARAKAEARIEAEGGEVRQPPKPDKPKPPQPAKVIAYARTAPPEPDEEEEDFEMSEE